MKSKLTYNQAEEKMLTVEWKTSPCGQDNCWCRIIEPKEPIISEDDEQHYVAAAGSLTKEVAEYLVELHNKKINGQTD